MSIEKIMEGIETKEGLILIIQQMISDTPNNHGIYYPQNIFKFRRRINV